MAAAAPQVVKLSHPGFLRLGSPVFRLSEGKRVPSMVIQLEGHEVVLPLRSMAQEFAIQPASDDGQMLIQIERALDFVVALRLGDQLPSELNGGTASWVPSLQDRKMAASRVRFNLARAVIPDGGKALEGGLVPGWDDAPENQAILRDVVRNAAARLSVADGAEVTERLAVLAAEVASIETLTRTIGQGTARIRDKMAPVVRAEMSMSRRDMVQQVQRLLGRGLKQLQDRCGEVHEPLTDIMTMLQNPQAGVAVLRTQRDRLMRTQAAWDPVFADWANAPGHFDDFMLKTLERTYSFLAPRFMSFQEWKTSAPKVETKPASQKVWI